MGNQSKQASQPTVVVIQQPASDASAQQQYLAQEIEQERAKARALEEELKRLKENNETE
jgi:hypothetical protein